MAFFVVIVFPVLYSISREKYSTCTHYANLHDCAIIKKFTQ